jgi:hypothetical protein
MRTPPHGVLDALFDPVSGSSRAVSSRDGSRAPARPVKSVYVRRWEHREEQPPCCLALPSARRAGSIARWLKSPLPRRFLRARTGTGNPATHTGRRASRATRLASGRRATPVILAGCRGSSWTSSGSRARRALRRSNYSWTSGTRPIRPWRSGLASTCSTAPGGIHQQPSRSRPPSSMSSSRAAPTLSITPAEAHHLRARHRGQGRTSPNSSTPPAFVPFVFSRRFHASVTFADCRILYRRPQHICGRAY